MNNSLNFNSGKSSDSLDVEMIRCDALNRLPNLLLHLFPNGKFKNNQFVIGNVAGNKGNSLKVTVKGDKAGMWHDFATGEGGDIFMLWANVKGLSIDKKDFPVVLKSLSDYLGTSPQPMPTLKGDQTPPLDNLGQYTGKWDYYDGDGNLIVCQYRYDTDNGKVFRPWNPHLKKYKALTPRPLFNQPGIKQDDHVVLVEGEKCAEALIQAGFAATTAMNGANAPIDKTDWAPLNNKHVLIWPDNDKPGQDYAQAVKRYLTDNGIAASVTVLDIPEDKPQKWDCVDAIDEGFNLNALINTPAIDYPPTNHYQAIIPCHWEGEPPQREWLIDDWLPRGYVTALYGDGGVGKSLLAQQLMTCLATGKPWLGLSTKVHRVYGLMCEDDEDELWRRQYQINKGLNLRMSDLDNMRFNSRVGSNNLLMTFDGKDVGKPTDFFNNWLSSAIEFAPDLVVLDTAADLFGGNENNRSQVRQFVQNTCGNIARTLNAAVLLCAHPSDSGIQRKTGTGGSTAWNNTVRSRWYLRQPNEDERCDLNERILSRKKSNYASQGGDLHLCWEQGVFNLPTHLQPKRKVGKKLANQHEQERKRKHDIILQLIDEQARIGHLYTMNQFCEAFENKTKLSLGSKDSIRTRLEVLATHGYVKFVKDAEQYGLKNPSRSKYGYLCVEKMFFGTGKGKADPDTGELTPELLAIYPSHYKCRETGAVLGVENPTIWVQGKEVDDELAHD